MMSFELSSSDGLSTPSIDSSGQSVDVDDIICDNLTFSSDLEDGEAVSDMFGRLRVFAYGIEWESYRGRVHTL